MSRERIEWVLQALDSRSQWFGGPSPAGSLRGVAYEIAARRPDGFAHCIWELALHIAYWEYAVRRALQDGARGGFSRKPSNWPAMPETLNADTWKADRRLVTQEREALVEAIRKLPVKRLDEQASAMSKNTTMQLLIGVVQHSVYHTGQIALLKRWATP
ncbi:MAG: DinB family protein [Thermoplasmata archaeon]|nr:DinB family protein [Thermoplasmata archaeon]